MKELLLVINEDSFFLSHRTRIAVNAARHGWRVTLVTKDTGFRNEIENMGFQYIELPINPTGMNLKDELKTFRFLLNLYRKHPSAIIHLVGLKNMLWGGIASLMTASRGVVYAVSGLGTLFGECHNGKLSLLIQKMLKFAMKRDNVMAIFQNHDDEDMFVSNGLIAPSKTCYIKGSGVDMGEYAFTPMPSSSPLIIIFTARMLREKGVTDLVEAAELLRGDYEGKIEFWLCGGLSNNPSGVKEDEIESMIDGSYIKWLGHRDDIKELLQQSSIMCFPSYYREGVPKSLIEASAIGRPIITTDSVGCRDTVLDGKNGIIVPPHSPQKLAQALKLLIDSPKLRESMGVVSRSIAERDYDVNDVASRHLEIYEKLWAKANLA